MGKKTKPHKSYPAWTEARFRSFVRSALRKAWMKWPPKYEAMKEARVGKKINSKTGRLAMHSKCAKCKKVFPEKDMQADHRIPAGSTVDSFDEFINKLFCHKDDIDILCKPCHKKKTAEERKK